MVWLCTLRSCGAGTWSYMEIRKDREGMENMTEKLLNQKYFKPDISFRWIKENSIIIHYCGRNKPWNSKYKGILNDFYNIYNKMFTNTEK